MLAAVAAVVVVGLLILQQEGRGGRSTQRDGSGDGVENGDNGDGAQPAAPLPDIDGIANERPRDPRTAAELARFVALAGATGASAVPQLLALLESGADVRLEPRWQFEGAALSGFPTLRSAYLRALAAIEGPEATRALETVLAGTTSVQESYLIALSLEARAATGWAGVALERADPEGEPALRRIAQSMVALAARADPAATSAYLVDHAPRGDSTELPRHLSHALSALPLDAAAASAERLLADRDVTVAAKSLYLRALCARPELEVIDTLTALAERGDLGESVGLEAAYALANAPGFRLAALDYKRARAERDAAAERAASTRFELRMERVRRFATAALGMDVDTSDDPRAAAIRRKLEFARKLLSN